MNHDSEAEGGRRQKTERNLKSFAVPNCGKSAQNGFPCDYLKFTRVICPRHEMGKLQEGPVERRRALR
jgi:hypothetical protein